MHDGVGRDTLQAALDTCASEPIHIPGTIQPFGYLLAFNTQTSLITHASENLGELFGIPLAEVLGTEAAAFLGSEIWHGLSNVRGHSAVLERRQLAGIFEIDRMPYSVHAYLTGDHLVVEFEAHTLDNDMAVEILREQNFLIEQIKECGDEEELLSLTTRLLRHVTGFDRVMIYKFDPEWNGAVIAEARRKSLEPFLGLNFPHWDIPEQVREIMTKVPIRMISDVEQQPVALRAADPDQPPLDLSLAHARGVSEIHLRYMKNMGSGGSLTLSLVQDDQLWGIISFHHQKPRVTTTRVRQLLLNFLPVFTMKLSLLREMAAVKLSKWIDALQAEVQAGLERETELDDMMQALGPAICEAFDVEGIALITGSQSVSHGKVPDQWVLEELVEHARQSEDQALISDNLVERLNLEEHLLQGVAGALVNVHSGLRALCLFREPRAQAVSWAGNSEQQLEVVDGNARLAPRGSFATFLKLTHGRCKPWSFEDRYLLRQLWPLLSAAERRSFMADLTRQQRLMIDELNHRVRNILSLVKSVSRQARRSGGSLESYSQALESRIHALAAAHDIGAGAAKAAVPVRQIIDLEAEPYRDENHERFRITGINRSIRADSAPIFALMIHELMTNAAKYGALSVPDGRVDIEIAEVKDGIQMTWAERGGPKIETPERAGFGTTLIKNAVPYELGGSSKLTFTPDGLQVSLTLPRSILEMAKLRRDGDPTIERIKDSDHGARQISQALKDGLTLIVEDNFVIASDLQQDLESYGFQNVEVAATLGIALELLESEMPTFAILDVNLGRGQTSERVAEKLLQHGVPFMFVTGYGEQHTLPPYMARLPRLTKPVTMTEMRNALSEVTI
ncbi:MAG: HWE histidine kinase domain-containing protein [Pseudomonadota bacterium]